MGVAGNLKKAIFDVLQPAKNGHYYALLLFSKTCDEKRALGKLLHRVGIGTDSIYWTENIKTE